MATGTIDYDPSYPLGTLPSGTNLNSVTRSCYLSIYSSYTNHPNSGQPTTLLVFRHSAFLESFTVQVAVQATAVYIRFKDADSGASWSAWRMLSLNAQGWQAAGTNIDNLTQPGVYGIDGTKTYTGTFPTGVTSGILEVIAPAPYGTYVIQRLCTGGAMYTRYRANSSGTAWLSWYKFTGTAA